MEGSAVQAAPGISLRSRGRDLIRKMALQALNATGRDKAAAERLYLQWLKENDQLLLAVAGPAVRSIILDAINNDMAQERRDVERIERARPVVTSSVSVGPAPRTRPQCLPIPSAAADERRAARIFHHSGWLAWPLPETGKPLGDAKAWEILDAAHAYQGRRQANGQKERFLKILWQALPDHDKPEAEQKRVAAHLTSDVIGKMDVRAQIAEAAVIASAGAA